jgi:hypothetical protein
MSTQAKFTASPRSRRARGAALLAVLAAALAGAGLLAAGCGGSSTQGVAQVGTTTTSTTNSSSSGDPQAAYASCMRRNGAPDFPDADSQGRFNLTPEVPRPTPGLERAMEACEELKRAAYALDPQLAEGRRQKLQMLLDYAACMRSHGVPNFPDPTVDGDGDGMGFENLLQSNVNPRAPAYRAAERACHRPGLPAPKPAR